MSLNDKFILDATAGFRTMWFNKRHPNCIYLDQRPECEPDVVGDFRNLSQFADETFRLIVFDPPFWIRNPAKTNMHPTLKTFGYLEPETWQSDLKKGINELWRILKPHGVLIGKWSTYQIASHEFLKLFPCKPLIYQVSAARQIMPKGTKRSYAAHAKEKVKTLWFCFMKIPDACSCATDRQADTQPPPTAPRQAPAPTHPTPTPHAQSQDCSLQGATTRKGSTAQSATGSPARRQEKLSTINP